MGIIINTRPVKFAGDVDYKKRKTKAVAKLTLNLKVDIALVHSDSTGVYRLKMTLLDPFDPIFGNDYGRIIPGLLQVFGQRPNNITQSAGFGCRIAFRADVYYFHGLSLSFGNVFEYERTTGFHLLHNLELIGFHIAVFFFQALKTVRRLLLLCVEVGIQFCCLRKIISPKGGINGNRSIHHDADAGAHVIGHGNHFIFLFAGRKAYCRQGSHPQNFHDYFIK